MGFVSFFLDANACVSDMEGTYLPAADVYTGANTKQIQISQGFNSKSMVDVCVGLDLFISVLYVCVSAVSSEYVHKARLRTCFLCLCVSPFSVTYHCMAVLSAWVHLLPF